MIKEEVDNIHFLIIYFHFTLLAVDYEEVEEIYHANDTVKPSILYEKYLNLTESEMRELAHRPQDMIKECRWNGEMNKMCENFAKNRGSKIYVPKFGVCYMINFKGANMESRAKNNELKAHTAGADHGLRLILDIESRF